MDIESKLRRAVQQYAGRPNRIVLKPDAAQELADVMVKKQNMLGVELHKLDGPSEDEIFLAGGMAYFKGIPLIAELESDKVLIVE